MEWIEKHFSEQLAAEMEPVFGESLVTDVRERIATIEFYLNAEIIAPFTSEPPSKANE